MKYTVTAHASDKRNWAAVRCDDLREGLRHAELWRNEVWHTHRPGEVILAPSRGGAPRDTWRFDGKHWKHERTRAAQLAVRS